MPFMRMQVFLLRELLRSGTATSDGLGSGWATMSIRPAEDGSFAISGTFMLDGVTYQIVTPQNFQTIESQVRP